MDGAFRLARLRASCVRATLASPSEASCVQLAAGFPSSGHGGASVCVSATLLAPGVAVAPGALAEALGRLGQHEERHVELLVGKRWRPCRVASVACLPEAERALEEAQRARWVLGWALTDFEDDIPPPSPRSITSLAVLLYDASADRSSGSAETRGEVGGKGDSRRSAGVTGTECLEQPLEASARLQAGAELAAVCSPYAAALGNATAAAFHMRCSVMAPLGMGGGIALLDAACLPGADGAPVFTGRSFAGVLAAPMRHPAAQAELPLMLPARQVLDAVRASLGDDLRAASLLPTPAAAAAPAGELRAVRAVHRGELADGRWATAVALSPTRFSLPAHLFGVGQVAQTQAARRAPLTLRCSDGRVRHARLVAVWSALDVALGEVARGEAPLPAWLPLAPQQALRSGQAACIVGYPLFAHRMRAPPSVSRGSLAVAPGRSGCDDLVSTDARLYEGASGGAVVLQGSGVLAGLALGNVSHERRGHDARASWAAGPGVLAPLVTLAVEGMDAQSARRELDEREARAVRGEGPLARL